jgi:hypothetical protein
MFEQFMKRSDWYYEEQLYDTSYSTDPTGAELSIDRLVNGAAAYWKTQTRCPATPRKKKLVITDWKGNRSPEFFDQLMDDGFELYVCQGTDVKLTSKNELRADLVTINPTYKEEVIQAMANQGIPADQVLVLDYFLMNQLECTDIQEPLHIINFNDLNDKNDEFCRSLLDSIEQDSRIGIKISNITNINGITGKYIEQFFKKSKHIFYLSSDIDYIECLFTSMPSLGQTLESLTVDRNDLNLNIEFIKKLINLKELNWGGLSISAKSFYSLLVHCPNLEKLNLRNCQNIEDSSEEFQLKESLKELKNLALTSSSITMKFLGSLLVHCPNLVKLDLANCNIIDDTIKELQINENLQKLKELNLGGSSITMKSLNKFLAHCPNLVKLDLNCCKNINDTIEELQINENLEKLKELSLSYSSITMKSLNKFLAHCPNLVKLNLSGCKNINDTIEELQINENLEGLKELDLYGTSITMKSLNKFLAHCPNLVKLNLPGCKNINDTIEELQINENLEKLKELSLSYSSITMKSLNKFLAHCPNLVKLNLPGCKNINDTIEELQINENLEGLKELDLRGTSITMKSLNRFLAHCPSLVKLSLAFSENIYDSNEELQIENLKKIKELDLSGPSITTKSLNRFLTHCPNLVKLNLVKLDLNSCININDTIEEFQINENLEKLKELDLSFSSITSESLIRLLKYCPNLKILDLTDADCFSSEDEQISEALSKIKTVKGLSNISSSSYARTSISTASCSDRASISCRRYLDKNTKYDKNTVLEPNQYFLSISNGQPDPHPSHYRLRVLDHIEKKNGNVYLDKPEPVLKKCEIEITSIDKIQTYCQQYKNKPDFFYGQISLSLAPGEKYSLPSLSSMDKIESLSSDVPVDVWYCEAENLYYVSLQGNLNQNATISYIIHTPTKQPPSFPVHIQELIKFYNDFEHPEPGAGKLNGIDDNSSDIEILDAIKEQKKGACRHRTMCFMNDIANMSKEELRGIKVRAVYNDCHAYPEISCDGGPYYRADLGGHACKLKIKKLEKLNLFSKNILLPEKVTSDSYCPWLLAQTDELLPQQRNALITFDNHEQLEQFNVAMLRHLVKEKKQYYYLDNLDDVTRKDIAFDNDTHEGSGYKIIDSNLISYIQQAKPGDVLIVNWSDYKPDHVGYNTLLDKERKFENIPIPDGVVILNLLTLSKTNSMREDFYSRIGIKTKLPNYHLHDTDIAAISSASTSSVANKYIDMYGDKDCEQYLLGTVSIQGVKLALQKGALIQALENNCSQLIIQNSPNLKMFRLFCEEVLQKRSFTFHGKTYTLPDNFIFKYETKTHDLDSGYSIMPLQDNEFHYSLNAKTLPNFFATYQCQGSQLYRKNGWLEQNSHQHIRVLITESLQESQWARLLDNAQTHQCHLEIVLAPDVTLPPAMQVTSAANKKRVARFPLLSLDQSVQNQKIAVVLSQDIDLTAEKMAGVFSAAILSVSTKMSFADLVGGITRDDNPDEKNDTNNELDLRFKSMTGVLLEKLRQGNVILKGTLSPDLKAKLETLFCSKPYLWVNGEKEENIPGRLMIVTEDTETFPFAHRYQDHVTSEDCWHLLEKKFSQSLIEKLKLQIQQNQKMTNYSYSQLTAMLQQLQKNETKNVFKPFQRLDSNPRVPAKKEKQVASDQDIDEKRLAKIIRYLNHSPYVFITGPSGVGKSSFIKNVLKENANLYVGLDNVAQWAQQPLTNGKRNILFIDEANLEVDGNFDIFGGLFDKPPGIVVNQKFYPLTDQYQIIFAGNFSGTEGRQQHNFFKKHGAVMTFKEYTDKELTKKIIEPVLNAALKSAVEPLSEEQRQDAIKIFLKIYHIVNQSSPQPKLTARNLQMICLRFTNRKIWQKTYRPLQAWLPTMKSVIHPLMKKLEIDSNKIVMSHHPLLQEKIMHTISSL